MAALEPRTDGKQPNNKTLSVFVEHEKSEFLLCTLEYGKLYQEKLDLMFVEGEPITFFHNGEGTVHLTGYLLPEEDDDYLDYNDELEEESDEEEEESDEEVPSLALNKAIEAKKRKVGVLDSSSDSVQEKKPKIDGKGDAPAKAKIEEKSIKNNQSQVEVVNANQRANQANKKSDKKAEIANFVSGIKNQQAKQLNNEDESDESEDDEEDESEDDSEDDSKDLGLLDNEAEEGEESEDDDDDEDDDESDESGKLQS